MSGEAPRSITLPASTLSEIGAGTHKVTAGYSNGQSVSAGIEVEGSFAYTASDAERDDLVQLGWECEDVGRHGMQSRGIGAPV